MTLLWNRRVLLTWLSPKAWKRGDLKGSWAWHTPRLERGWLYLRVLGAECSLTWGKT